MCANVLPCPLCCQPNFSNVDSLRISLVNVTNRPLACPICQELQMGLDKFTIHLFSHTLHSKPFQTMSPLMITNYETTKPKQHQSIAVPEFPLFNQINSVPHNRKSLSRTDQTLNPSQYVKVEISEHLSVNHHTAKDSPEPQCNICGSTFRNHKLHLMHMQLAHQVCVNSADMCVGQVECTSGIGNPEANDFEPSNGVAANGQTAKNRFQCHLCPKHFKIKGSLRVHLRVVHPFGRVIVTTNIAHPKSTEADQLICSMSIKRDGDNSLNVISTDLERRSTLISRMKVEEASGTTMGLLTNEVAMLVPMTPIITNSSETKPWECDICSKSFTTKYFLKKHKRLHTGEMPYTCDVCSKTFTFQQSYHKHLLYHNDDKPHVCNICNRAFKELSTLHNHERIHSGEKPFKCETCEKCFRQRVSYLVHRRIHTGVMPYKCTACDKSFRYKVSQRTHKCLAQPPGEVIRQPGDLLQRLIQSSCFIQSSEADSKPTLDSVNGISPSLPINGISGSTFNASSGFPLQPHVDSKLLDECHMQLTNQSLDDLVAEHCVKIGISGAPNEDETKLNMFSQEQVDESQVPSPSEQFQHLCLYSPQAIDGVVTFSPNPMDTMDDSGFEQFLFGNE